MLLIIDKMLIFIHQMLFIMDFPLYEPNITIYDKYYSYYPYKNYTIV